jgi:hypothetical protein
MRLVKMGCGSLSEVQGMDAFEVLQAINYEKYCADYEAAYIEINRG